MIAEKTVIHSEAFDAELFEDLRVLRLEIAKRESVPPFMIFSDASLKDIARLQPIDDTNFLQVSGVGPVKLEKYGFLFINKIKEYKKS